MKQVLYFFSKSHVSCVYKCTAQGWAQISSCHNDILLYVSTCAENVNENIISQGNTATFH